MTMIDVNALHLAFGAVNVLNNVNLQVREGQSFGLVGESGSGKTTVLRCLAGQYTHWEGNLQIAGRALGHKPHWPS